MTIILVIHSSILSVIKCILIALIFIQFKFDLAHQSPCSTIQEIQFCKNKWVLVMRNGKVQQYEEATILIHNILFQLIELSTSNKSKFLILFNDQLPKAKLRLLHLKITEK